MIFNSGFNFPALQNGQVQSGFARWAWLQACSVAGGVGLCKAQGTSSIAGKPMLDFLAQKWHDQHAERQNQQRETAQKGRPKKNDRARPAKKPNRKQSKPKAQAQKNRITITPASTPNSSGSWSLLFWTIHSWRQISARHAMGDKGRQGETKKVIPAQHPDTPWETRGDEGRQSKIISAQHPDMLWETRGDKERQSKLISASRHAMGDKGGQNKIISAQHPDTPWETRGDKGRESSWPGLVSMQELRTPHSKAVWGKKEPRVRTSKDTRQKSATRKPQENQKRNHRQRKTQDQKPKRNCSGTANQQREIPHKEKPH